MSADRHGCAARPRLVRERSRVGSETPALIPNHTARSCVPCSARIERDDATEASSILSGKTGCKNIHCFEFVILEGGSECNRPVVVQRHAVDHVLGVVLRSTGMEHSVGFEQPARHGCDDVGSAASRRGAQRFVKLLASGLENKRGLTGIEKWCRVANGDFAGDCTETQGYGSLLRYRGSDLDRVFEASKAGAINDQAINTRRKPLQACFTRGIRIGGSSKVGIATDQLDASGNGTAVGVLNRNAKLAFHDLGEGRSGVDDRDKQNKQRRKNDSVHNCNIPDEGVLFSAEGVVVARDLLTNTTPSAPTRRLRDCFLMSRPPLLG